MAPDSIRPLSLHQLRRRSLLRSTLTDNIHSQDQLKKGLTKQSCMMLFDSTSLLPFKSLVEKNHTLSKAIQSVISLPMPDWGSI